MKKPVTHALIAAGFNPGLLFKAVDGAINVALDEQNMMSRYGCRLTTEEERKQEQLFKLMDVLDRENEITCTRDGRIKTGLN